MCAIDQITLVAYEVNAYLLSDRIGWFGDHTGYEQLPRFLAGERLLSLSCITPPGGFLPRALGKLSSLALGHGRVNQAQAFARLAAFAQLSLHRDTLLHILYGEEHARYWGSFPARLQARTVLTIHQPPSQWTAATIGSLQWVRHAILLYTRDLPFFREAMPKAQLYCIPHGVDINFFSPSNNRPSSGTKRLLYNGVHLRNVAMLRRIVPIIINKHPDVVFDFLVPLHRRDEREFGELLEHSAITWHAGLNDHQLLDLYQHAYALLLPMSDSGANTAVVESLACGLPIITTDVGGIRDYGGATVFCLVNNNDDSRMIQLVDKYLKLPAWRDEVAVQCRRFAERELSWPLVARRHADVYRSLAV